MAASSTFNWSRGNGSFHERMNNVDPDFRQMALYDLSTMLAREDFTISEADQGTAINWVSKCFGEQEKNTEVVNNAVRIVGPLALKLSQRNQETLIVRLCKVVCDALPSSMTQMEATALRENAAMSLKLTVQSFASRGGASAEGLLKSTAPVVAQASRILAQGLTNQLEQRVRSEIFDVLADFSEAYGNDIAGAHGYVLEVCLKDISSASLVRKRATKCLAKLAPHLAQDLFASVTAVLTRGLGDANATKTFVEVCNAVCRTAAKRFDNASVVTIVSCFLQELKRLQGLPEDQIDSREAEETREQILSALESFTANCKDHLLGQLDDIFDALRLHVQWDPNFCYVEGDDETEYFDDEDDGDIDDGDTSWKVRIAAARCLSRVVGTFGSVPSKSHITANVLQVVLSRLGERVEQVRLAILDVLMKILEVCRGSQSKSDDTLFGPQQPSARSLALIHTDLAQLLLDNRATIVDKLVLSAKHKDLKVKLGSIVVFKELYALFGSDMEGVDKVLQVAASAMQADPRRQLPTLRPESLALTHRLVVIVFRLDVSAPNRGVLIQHLHDETLPQVLDALQDRFFKTAIAALKVAQQLIFLAFEMPAVAASLFAAVQQRLTAPDSDLEMKRVALETIALMIAYLHQQLGPSQHAVHRVLEHLCQLLTSETIRVAACKAVDAIAQAPGLPQPVMAQIGAELSGLLRKSDRQVRECALVALTRVVVNYTAALTSQTINVVVDALCATNESAFIDEKDLFVTSQALALAAAMASHCGPAVAKVLVARLSASVVRLLCCTQVQGLALEHSLSFFSKCPHAAPETAQELLKRFNDAVASSTLSSVPTLSLAVGSVIGCLAETAGKDVASSKTDEFIRHPNRSFAFACVGSAGRYVQLSAAAKKFLLDGHNGAESQEDCCAAAALGLGRAASSAPNASLLNDIGTMLRQAADDARHQHLLRALKEAIVVTSGDKSRSSALLHPPTATAVLATLLTVAARNDEFLADVVTESVGRLAAVNFLACVDELLAAAKGGNAPLVATAIGAMKFVTPQSTNEEGALAQHLPTFLQMLARSASPVIRRSSIQLFHSTVLHRPHLLVNQMQTQQFLRSLFDELVIDTTLVSEVDLGPFKHRIDNGIELRKVAHECVQSLLDELLRGGARLASCMNDVLWAHLATQLAVSSGLPEEQETEVCNSARTALTKVAKLCPAALPGCGGVVGKKLLTTLNSKAKDGLDAEKVNDHVRIGIMCILVLTRECPELLENPVVAEALKAAQASDKYRSATMLPEPGQGR